MAKPKETNKRKIAVNLSGGQHKHQNRFAIALLTTCLEDAYGVVTGEPPNLSGGGSGNGDGGAFTLQ